MYSDGGDPPVQRQLGGRAAHRNEGQGPYGKLMRHTMQLNKIIVASGNEGKLKEIGKIFKGAEIVPMREAGFTGDIEENGQSFRENAYIKAKAVCDSLGLPALADDSGLCVDYLGGAPGIFSARFSGEGDNANRRLLLEKMQGAHDRRAHFECAVCLCLPDGRKLFGVGEARGSILEEERGSRGFGYDSLFYSDDLKKSFGEATAREKNGVSHRARALKDLMERLKNF